MSGRKKAKSVVARKEAPAGELAAMPAASAAAPKESRRRKRGATALEDRIGYRFTDGTLLDCALTHISALKGARNRAGSYQRLEFLGDHVLGLVISDMLYRAYPKADEGELSRRLADLVRKETCAEIARTIDLGPAIRVGSSEANAGARSRLAILADVCEAVIGAAYLDGGYKAAEELVERLWQARMQATTQPLRDPKTVLQEWAQARGLPTPAYREVARSGPRASAGPSAPPSRRRPPPYWFVKASSARAAMVEPSEMAPSPEQATRCGFVALIGAPNAGKSTLINALVGTKVSIVTPKVQTTRTLIRGIAVIGAAQLIFVDTPGIFSPKRRLDRAMVGTAWGSTQDADLVALLVDSRKGLTDDEDAILRTLADIRPAKVLVLNKVDLIDKLALLALTQKLNERAAFAATFMISALSGDGVGDLKAWFAAHVPSGPWLYPEDQISDAPMRQLAAEITREKLYLRLHQELPYRSTVETEVWKELRDGSVRIEQTIYVERESQRKIVLGKAGQAIKAIGAAARIDIAAAVEQPVHLFLHVKVREGWGDDPERYREMGLEFPKE
jgi:GTPase